MLDPDQQHEDYYKGKPLNWHSEPAGETLRFMKRQNEINESIEKRLYLS